MVFCNILECSTIDGVVGHNPYFNRWFSAISDIIKIPFMWSGHNPYFNRWFSAIYGYIKNNPYKNVTILILIDGFLQFEKEDKSVKRYDCHNPYFNRWFSAIKRTIKKH